ncbi:UDP-N-acetylmuramoyl-tripeptide--D-alanyl-D-alanine ligase [Peristeroidobacter agariperforans]|uniref:UDP-N-acetylmuramoyl-tripeptide--D-alanyl-D- alanine ligase n=1 Tax=Peristeroidobacter agariperforans TaxID=268404 RepID=UPI00101CDE9D|nr:UDP-N-acetylmuramoyl-tripeptide--D-alanyl-D-alanine ligase [Peristeroidobacter agariperforans]
MIAWKPSEIVKCAQGQLVGADRAFTSVSTDTRTIKPGALFVALSGPSFDGHDFVATAAQNGAAAALVAKQLPVDVPQIVVADPLAALSAFAREWRRQFPIPVVGVTGSNGKTTTKELIGSILSQRGPTLVTRGNLNNHIGVPLTLLELTKEHRFAVIEMGANHVGEIAHLASLAEPTVGIVTNAGAAHLEGFGSLDGVATGKGEMFQALPFEGVAVINADDKYAWQWRDASAADRILTFGFEQPADFMAHKVREVNSPSGFRIDFDLVTPDGTLAATVPLAGLHNLRNALGAAAAACAAGTPAEQIVKGLAAMKTVAGRLELKPAINGAFIVDDSYNANPSSLKAGLDAMKSFAGTRWLVLGEMKELGNASNELHAEVGRYARQAGIERLLAIGEGSRFSVEAFGRGGQWFADIDALIRDAKASLTSGVAVLIKGSRANRLERVSAALSATPPGNINGHH